MNVIDILILSAVVIGLVGAYLWSRKAKKSGHCCGCCAGCKGCGEKK